MEHYESKPNRAEALRFIRAQKFSVPKAITMYNENLVRSSAFRCGDGDGDGDSDGTSGISSFGCVLP